MSVGLNAIVFADLAADILKSQNELCTERIFILLCSPTRDCFWDRPNIVLSHNVT